MTEQRAAGEGWELRDNPGNVKKPSTHATFQAISPTSLCYLPVSLSEPLWLQPLRNAETGTSGTIDFPSPAGTRLLVELLKGVILLCSRSVVIKFVTHESLQLASFNHSFGKSPISFDRLVDLPVSLTIKP